MYASQTKRLCVREVPSDETRVQHHSNSSAEATTDTLFAQQQSSTTSDSPSSQNLADNEYRHLPSTSLSPQTVIKKPRSSAVSATVIGLESSSLRSSKVDSGPANMTASATDNAICNTDGNQSANKTSRNNKNPVIQRNNESALDENKLDGASEDSTHSQNLTEQQLIDKLVDAVSDKTKLESILSIRNLITACNKRKESLLRNTEFSKLVHLIDIEDESSFNVKTQFALLLCSIAKGGESYVKILNESNVGEKVLRLMLTFQDDPLTEACLRCLRAMMSWPLVSRQTIFFEKPSNSNNVNDDIEVDLNLKKIIEYAQSSKSFVIQECISDIFALTCSRNRDQLKLLNQGALSLITRLVESSSNRVVVSALNWLTTICLKNETVSHEAYRSTCPSGLSLSTRLVELMRKDECDDLQFLSAKCFTQIYRALPPDLMNDEKRISIYVLPTLVRMAQNDKPSKLRVEAAECIAYLIEHDRKLQETASICDHLIRSLGSMLDQDSSSMYDFKDYLNQYQHPQQLRLISSMNRNLNERDLALSAISIHHRQNISPHILDLRSTAHNNPVEQIRSSPDASVGANRDCSESSQEMKRAAFLALAALASTQESIRKKIFETCAIMQHLVRGLSENEPKNLKSVLTCLLSLSRSVQQLRTSFAESSIYSYLKGLLNNQSNEILILVLAVLCNISLDFSPSKQQFLDSATINTLCNLTRDSDPFLRLHAMWILMNMMYQLKDQNLKFQIFRSLGPSHVLEIIENETYEELLLKTLGFLRNLLSQRSHIDAIMANHGEQIMNSLAKVLERPCSSRVKEQALCVLTNIADGSESKGLIMKNRVVLSYLARTIGDEKAGDLELAAVCCITNLAHREQDGSLERRDELRRLGVEDKLKSILYSNDPILSDRVRTAYNHFCREIEEK